jgi:glutathione reductase (NADPH)
MTLYAVGVGLFALVMMLRVRIGRGLRLGDTNVEMKSHASSSINGADSVRAQYLCDAQLEHGFFAMLAALGFPVTTSWTLRANHVSDDLKWNPLNLLPSDSTAGLQPVVFATDPSSEYDAIVIGGGSGGSGFAKRAVGYGAKVCVIERGATYDENGLRTGAGPGGTCVNVGCVPKKIMFMAAAHREMMTGPAATAKGYGFDVPEEVGKVDWAALKARRDAYVGRLTTGYKGGWQNAGVEVIDGVASFKDAKTISIEDSEGKTTTISGKNIVIACGGVPKALDIPGGELVINSDSFFELEEQPKKVAVIGAGYIAVEMAGIFEALGSETHLFFRGEGVLRGFDPFIQENLMEALQNHGPTLHPLSTPASIKKESDGTLTYSTTEGPDGKPCEYSGFDCILCSIGRRPVTDVLDLDKAGVETTAGGFIKVDEYENTNVDGILAIGDATTTGYELTPVALAAGRRLGDRLFGGEARARIEYETIGTVVFSHPPIGVIGLTEPQAKKEFGEDNIVVKTAKFGSMLYAFNEDEHKVKTGLKLVLKLPEERIVGMHIIGPYSDEIMQGFAVAVRMGATRADFEASVAIHPTIGEELVTFGGWGQDRSGVPQLPPHLR